MCGIVGSVMISAAGSRLDAGILQRMRDAMAHRGPDGAGQWVADDGRGFDASARAERAGLL